ncbi:Uncharacterised protein [Legionella quateirensis]|uniref:Uncharacterized protein n=1 Tax=Legionella quateirensis TaxID=45072 RepID=A0A378KUG3_9GAMM|nr:hypothetical protein Lqua_3344 [Legionella quateirensis]STY17147.1 Uncharacterised protein [Legionella quateirensis]
MKHSEIRVAYAQDGTFLNGARFAGLPGLRASHFIQATLNTEIYTLNDSLFKRSDTTVPKSGWLCISI